MNRLPFALALLLVMALAATAIARAPATPAPPGNAYGAYGCCCPYSAWLEVCPMSPGAFLQGYHDVCLILDDHGAVKEFCDDDPDGVYPYRGMTPHQFTLAVGDVFGETFRNVGQMLDFFCGYDWDRFVE